MTSLSSPPSPRGRSSSMRKTMKYIVVTGGVVSGLGKGITISSVGVILKRCGFRVTSIKIDPYLNHSCYLYQKYSNLPSNHPK